MRTFEIDGVTYTHPYDTDSGEPGVDVARQMVQLIVNHVCYPKTECRFDLNAGDTDMSAKLSRLPGEGAFSGAFCWRAGDPVARFGGVS